MPASVSAIVVAYAQDADEASATLEAVRRVQRQSHAPEQVVLVDNHPDHRAADLIERSADGVTVVRAPTNLGFTGGTWLGAEAATGEMLFFINPDARADERCVETLVAALDADPLAAVAGAQVLLPDGTVNAGDNPVHVAGLSWCGNYRGLPEQGAPRQVMAVSGAAMLVRADVFRRLRGFADRFFLYFDDTDFCWRAQLAGRHVWLCPDARVEHDYEDKGPHRWLWVERNRVWMVLANYERRTLVALLPVLLLIEAAMWTASIAQGWAGYKARSYADIVRALPWLRTRRRFVAATRETGDAAMLERLSASVEAVNFPRALLLPLNAVLRLYVAVRRAYRT